MRSPSAILLLASAGIYTSVAAMKTSIYIDQVPGYKQLASCAEDRLSAIVRAQSSGCGDAQQLTSFSCFCIDQSSMMSSIISTAVQEQCKASATGAITTPLSEVTQAVKVFDAYCARSTELVWYQNNSTQTSIQTITPAPSTPSTPSTSPSTTSDPPAESTGSSSSDKNTVPVAAIAAPVVIGVLAIAGVVGLLFWLQRRRADKSKNAYSDKSSPAVLEAEPHGRVEMPGYGHQQHVEAPGESVKYRHELETKPVELEGSRKS